MITILYKDGSIIMILIPEGLYHKEFTLSDLEAPKLNKASCVLDC